MQICNVCSGALEHRRNIIVALQLDHSEDIFCDETFGHHQSWQSLHNSAEAGCWLCQAASQSLLSGTKTWSDVPPTPKTVMRGSDGLESLQFVTLIGVTMESDEMYGTLQVIDAHSDDQFSATTFSLMRSSAMGPTLDALQSTLSMSRTTSSPSSMQIIRQWLWECCRDHESCNKGKSIGTWFPTRLLDLGAVTSVAKDVRLVVTSDELPDGPYATLSHCWGQKHFIQLTKSNITSFCQSISIEDMPRTFQDAIIVCKSLNIRYLWIDSLCILQDRDDLSDWSREAGAMDRVYSFSHCNISASDAVDGSWGLFRNREPSSLDRRRVSICRTNQHGTLDTEEYFAEDYSLWRTNVTEALVNQRGWIFQERILAPRVLHFCGEQIFWECREFSACEKYPNGFDGSFLSSSGTKGYFHYNNLATNTMAGKLDTHDEIFCYKMWSHMIYRYSSTSLTRPSDKLVAMSGIAKALGALLQDTYVAGLWRRNLEVQLLWSVAGQDPPASRSNSYRAPTWSWASIDGQVMWIEEDWPRSEIRAHVQSVHIVHATADMTGQVTGGYLDLFGYLKPLHTLPNSTAGVFCEFDDPNEDGPEAASEEQRDGSQLYFMTILVTTTCVKALLLRPVEHQEGMYRRVGILWQDSEIIPSHAKSRAAILQDLNDKVKVDLPCLRYAGGKHVIRIV